MAAEGSKPRWEEALFYVSVVAFLMALCLVGFRERWIARHGSGGGGSSNTERGTNAPAALGKADREVGRDGPDRHPTASCP